MKKGRLKLKSEKVYVPCTVVFINLIFGVIMSAMLLGLYLSIRLEDFTRNSYDYIHTLHFFHNSYISLFIFMLLYIISNMLLYGYFRKKYGANDSLRYIGRIVLITLIPVLLLAVVLFIIRF